MNQFSEDILYLENRTFSQLLSDFKQLIKLKLNLLVVFATFVGFLIGSKSGVNWLDCLIVCFGGFLTVGAANGLNQIIEKESDKLMSRTQNRPLVQNRLSVWEAVIICLAMGLGGVLLIGFGCNALCGILSLTSLVLYSFVYTPLKKVSKISVHIGAIPGATSPMIGYIASGRGIDGMAITLFLIQFFWQFPHFYSIAWLLFEDYKKAGLKLMPIGSEKDRSSAIQIAFLTTTCILVVLFPLYFANVSLISIWILALSGLGLFIYSIKLCIDLEDSSAKKLMFASFIYLPLTQLTLLADKWLQ